MPKYVITSPDGKKYEVTAPDGASESEVMNFVMSQHAPKPEPEQPKLDEPSLLVGIGKGMNDVARGVGDLFGKPNLTGIEPDKRADAAINDSTIGTIGQVVGNMAATAPAMLIPGANTLVGGAAIGAGTGALTTEGNAGKRLESGAMGGVMGAAGSLVPYAANLVAKAFAPFGSAGQKEKIVGRMLNSITEENAPDIIARLESAQSLVKGSNPTAAEVAKSGGISAVQRFAAGANPEKFAYRDSENAAARLAAIQGIAGDEAKLQAAKQTRSNATSSDYSAIHDKFIQSNPDLERILNTDAGKSAVANARKLAANEYRQFGEKTPTMPTDEIVNSVSQPVPASRTHWTQQPIDYERDNMLTAIRKLGGINKELAQQTYGNEMWRDGLGNGLFRNQNGMSLDDMAMRLHEHGYIDASEANPNDLAKALYRGYGNEMFSNGKQSFDSVYSAPEPSEKDLLMERLGRLTDALEAKNAPKPEAPKKSPYETSYYGRDLHNIQRSLGAMAGDQNLDPVLRHSIGNVLGDYKGVLEKNIPELLATNKKFEELSRPINQMQVGQELLNKLGGSLTQHGAGGSEMMNRYATALNDVKGNLVKNSTGGIKKSLKDVMTHEQMGVLNNIAKDLARKKNANDLGRGAGSNTFQNFAMNGLSEAAGIPSSVSGLLQVLPPVNMAKGIMGKLYEAPEKEMKGILSDALLDPKETARLMKMAQKRGLLDAANDYKGLGGLLGIGISNTTQNQRD
ncbi:MAG: hypothetical protein WBI40_13150 [Methylococcaceae bacterium]